MRFLRILLQLIILSGGEIALLILISQHDTDLTAIVIFCGFVAFVLALIETLREYHVSTTPHCSSVTAT